MLTSVFRTNLPCLGARSRLTLGIGGIRTEQRRWKHVEKGGKKDEPIKFTSSKAHVDYRATFNFYGEKDRHLPPSHNYMIAATGFSTVLYLIYVREHLDVNYEGPEDFVKPLHETVPAIAIPLIQSAIAENKRFGYNTDKLEKKLEELEKNPKKHGGGEVRRKLVDN